MSNHSFMFLDNDFKDISKFCMRMEKNIVEGDGVDAVIWAGKIAERVTNYIIQFINLDLKGLKQHEKLEKLFEGEVIPEKIYKDFNSIRFYRNIATHRDLRDELKIANNLHRTVFNILCWFYGTYSGDPSYANKKYMGIIYRHDPSFIDMISKKSYPDTFNHSSLPKESIDNNYIIPDSSSANINTNFKSYSNKYFSEENVNFNKDLNCWSAVAYKNNKTITIGHYKSKEMAFKRGLDYVSSDEFKNYTYISIPPKLKGGVYSYNKGINFSEKNLLWTASHNKKFLGYFISESRAIIARKEYIDTLPLPEKKNGFYSNHKEISFDENQKMWYIKKDDDVIYYDSEEEAIRDLPNQIRLEISSEDLGIHFDEKDSKWRFTYNDKFVAAYDNEKEAREKRLKHISQFAQPKRNKNGDYSIHRGIYYDKNNLIWVLSIKDEIIGFYDSEEKAFNAKKEFLKLKGFDVTNLIFNEEEDFDDNFDFKVKLYSDENAVEFDKKSNQWISYFMGRVIARAPDEESARRLRKQYLKDMPFVPRKPNGKYSYFEGIDYDKSNHLWIAYNGEKSLGLFDSEEDAFYARKESLIADGEDVSNMHFSANGIISTDYEDQTNSSDSTYLTHSGLIDYKTDSISKSNLSDDDTNDLADDDLDKDDSLQDANIFSSDVSDSTVDDEINVDKNSLKDIEDFKKSPLFGIGLKRDENNFSALDNIAYDDLESDDDIEDEYDEIDLTATNSDDNGFTNMNENIDLKINRKDIKEIILKSYDDNNYRREITISYNKKNLFLSYEGVIKNNDLKRMLALDLLDNSEKLEFNKIDSKYFSIFFRLKYKLEFMDLELLFKLLTDFGWNFDLLDILNKDSDSIFNFKSLKNIFLSSDEQFSLNTKDISKKDDENSVNGDFGQSNSKELISPAKEDQNAVSKDLKFGGDRDISKNVASEDMKFGGDRDISKNVASEDMKFGEDRDISKNVASEDMKFGEDRDISKKVASDNAKSNGRKLIRGGKVVTEEEAMRIDNAVPEKEIKTNIIYKKPDNIKQNFNSLSLGDVIKWNNDNGKSDDTENSEDLGFEVVSDDEIVSPDNSGNITVEAVDSEDIFTFDEDSSFDLDEAINASKEDSDNNLKFSVNDMGDDEGTVIDPNLIDEDEHIQEVLDILNRSRQFDVEDDNSDSQDEHYLDCAVESEDIPNSNIVDDNAEESIGSFHNNDSADEVKTKEEAIQKPKKVKKESKVKKLAIDAFDEKYANSLEIEHDENDRWLAFAGGIFIKSFDNPKEAFMARKKYLRRRGIPKKNSEGKFSYHEGIDYDTSERMWTSSINNVVIMHCLSEKDAIKIRELFIDNVLPNLEIEVEDFDEESLNIITKGDFKKLLIDVKEEEN